MGKNMRVFKNTNFLLFAFFAFVLVILSQSGFSQGDPEPDPELLIDVGSHKKIYKRSDLLRRPDLITLKIEKDVSFPGRVMTYQAVPVAALFEGLHLDTDAVIQFRCSDGFAAPISKERLLNKKASGSHAYVAIETKENPWPPVKPGGPVAGPFYLVWPDADLSQIMQEEWPFQLAAFEVKGALDRLYPKIFPAANLPAKHPVRLGMDVFVKNCFPCHTMNKEGAGHVGPDLNLPHSPTEYFKKPFLRQLIRDNQSVRHFPNGKMGPFSIDLLPEKELDYLLQYLESMAQKKKL
jgi:mono/diheme cytochrome c family protein